MKENLLQYLWNFKIFSDFNFTDIHGNSIEVLDFGTWNSNAGPDFLLGKIKTQGITLAGNIELHVRSSDWIFHRHTSDPNYDNIIMHAVFIHDTDLPEFEERKIPTLELQKFISQKVIAKYEIMLAETVFIPCEKVFDPQKIPIHFFEEQLLQKLELKAEELEKTLHFNKNNYEALLFQTLAYAFGLKVNADIFLQIAQSIDYSVIQKIRQNRLQLEALFFGISGWLDAPEDAEMQRWKTEFEFLQAKYNLPKIIIRPQFLRLRPPNFPTLRLSQFAHLNYQHTSLFSHIISARSIAELYQIFGKISASEYWDSRYNFGKTSSVHQQKILSRDFINLVIINAILPLQYLYYRNRQEENTEDILTMYSELAAEKNSVLDSWKKLGVAVKNALHSQSLGYHFRHFCIPKKCLHCSIGFKILKEK